MPPGDPVPGAGPFLPRTDKEEKLTQSASDACNNSDGEEDRGDGVSCQENGALCTQKRVRALTTEVMTLEQSSCPS